MSDNFLLSIIENKKKIKKIETNTSNFSLSDFINILDNCSLKYDNQFDENINNLFAATANLFFLVKKNNYIENTNFDYKQEIDDIINSLVDNSVKISEANKNKKVIKTDNLKTLTEKVNKVIVNIKKI